MNFCNRFHVVELMNVVAVPEEIRGDFPGSLELAVFPNEGLATRRIQRVDVTVVSPAPRTNKKLSIGHGLPLKSKEFR
jgi:hypothetical protein